jgi:hypothetical protein
MYVNGKMQIKKEVFAISHCCKNFHKTNHYGKILI